MNWRDESERVYHQPPKVTPEREDAWRRWVDDYAFACAERFIGQGESEEDSLAAAEVILADWGQLDGLDWMPLGFANAQHVGAMLTSSRDEPLTGAARLDYMLATRTRVTANEHELVLAAAYQLGISPQQARTMVGHARSSHPTEDEKGSRTALYRYYDSTGALLYVGITKNADLRDDQHQKSSGWHGLAARRELDWFPTRPDAEKAEREAIRSEEPLFNTVHANESTKTRAIEYLLAQVTANRLEVGA